MIRVNCDLQQCCRRQFGCQTPVPQLHPQCCCREPTDGAAVATKLLLQIARDKGYSPPTDGSASNGTGADRSLSRAGSVRLRDAVVWGYMMQRNARRGQVSMHVGAAMLDKFCMLQSCHLIEAVIGVCTGTQQDLRACLIWPAAGHRMQVS